MNILLAAVKDVRNQSGDSESKDDEVNLDINRILHNISDNQEMIQTHHDKIRENRAALTKLELDFKSLANMLVKVSKGMNLNWL